MGSPTRRTIVPIALVFVITISCLAQVKKVSPEDVLAAAYELKNAAVSADRLTSEGSKYCKWGVAAVDSADLENAIADHLLNRRSNAPENIDASKMWHVDLLAADLADQIAVGTTECDLNIRYSDGARDVSKAASSRLTKLMMAREKFVELAYQQTKWEEQDATLSKPSTPGQVDLQTVRESVREMKKFIDMATKTIIEADTTSGCIHGDSPTKPPEVVNMTKLLDYMDKASPSIHIPAANMWGITQEVEVAKLQLILTSQACSPYAGEKKKARAVATESISVYHRLRAAIASFEALALRQIEWEEQAYVKVQEQ